MVGEVAEGEWVANAFEKNSGVIYPGASAGDAAADKGFCQFCCFGEKDLKLFVLEGDSCLLRTKDLVWFGGGELFYWSNCAIVMSDVNRWAMQVGDEVGLAAGVEIKLEEDVVALGSFESSATGPKYVIPELGVVAASINESLIGILGDFWR